MLEELADWFRRSAQNGNPGCSVRLRQAGFAERCRATLQLLHEFSDAATVEPRARAAEPMGDYVGPVPIEVLALNIPPIAGGAPAYEPTAEEERDWTPMSLGLDREPIDDRTDEDWDEYAKWSHAQDAAHRDLYGY